MNKVIPNAIAANNVFIRQYKSGVIDSKDCYNPTKDPDYLNPINHAVTIVGYGTDEATGLEYWLIRNSWNTTWGDKGYVKIKIDDSGENVDGVCGVNKYPIAVYAY